MHKHKKRMNMELRDSPRYRVYLQIELDGIELTANNISSTGMQVSCPEFLFGRIQDTVESDLFDVNIALPLIDPPCKANVKMVYNSTYGDEHLLGMEYVDLDDAHHDSLAAYLQGLADRNAPVVE